MILNERPKKSKIEIDLAGPDGNAFVLLGIAKDLCGKIGIEWEPIYEEMTSGDYENLINVLEKHFGEFIVMYKSFG
jgi:hypothetical protein